MSNALRVVRIGPEKVKSLLIDKNASIKETMRLIDRNGMGIAFITEKIKKKPRKKQ